VNIDFHTNSDQRPSLENHSPSLRKSANNNNNNLYTIELNNKKYLPISEIEGISDDDEEKEEEIVEEVKVENSHPRTKTSGAANPISESFQIDNLADLIEYFEEKLFPGEKIATYINCSLVQMHNKLFHIEGVLFITNFKVQKIYFSSFHHPLILLGMFQAKRSKFFEKGASQGEIVTGANGICDKK